MIIDSHQHFWEYDPNRHSWIDENMSAIRRDFLPSELKSTYTENGIDGCIAVQADQTLTETDFLLKISEEHDFIKGVVGWLDLRAENVAEVLEKYLSWEKLKGFRHIVQAETDHDFLMRPHFLRGISLLEAHGYTYDLLLFPHQLRSALEFIKHFPNQKFVIDHIAKPNIKEGFYDDWAVLMTEISRYENVFCKLSGMITEADFSSWTPSQIIPYMDLVLNTFGPDRIMFGSDWPVCLVAGSYSEVKKLVTDFIAQLGTAQQAAIMGLNAAQFYNLK